MEEQVKIDIEREVCIVLDFTRKNLARKTARFARKSHFPHIRAGYEKMPKN